MPTIYINDGLLIKVNNKEKGHNRPHVHVLYRDKEYVFSFDGEQLEGGRLPRKIIQEVRFYLANHQDYLNGLWKGDY